MPPGKSWNFYYKISRTWKVLENNVGPGKYWKSTCKILEFFRQWCRWQFLVSNRHVFADENSHNCCHQIRFRSAGMPKMFLWPGLPDPAGGAYSTPPDPLIVVCRFISAHYRCTRNSYEKVAPKTRTRNLHKIEHALFDARNSREKYLASSQYDTRTNFSYELTHTSFSYICHRL